MLKQPIKRKHYKGIYLLPNAITLASLFSGFYAIVNAFQGNFELAVLLVFLCVILDGIDGPVARMLNMDSHFGAELDSLTDAIVFGVAPALIMYQWMASNLTIIEFWEPRVIWLITSFYVASTVLRLARFNVQLVTDKGIFRGLPSPAAAALVVSLIWVSKDFNLLFGASEVVVAGVYLLVLVLLSIAMVSRCSYYSLRKADLSSRVPFISLATVAAVLTVAAIDFPRFLLGISLIYALSGPVIYLIRILRKRQESGTRVFPYRK